MKGLVGILGIELGSEEAQLYEDAVRHGVRAEDPATQCPRAFTAYGLQQLLAGVWVWLCLCVWKRERRTEGQTERDINKRERGRLSERERDINKRDRQTDRHT